MLIHLLFSFICSIIFAFILTFFLKRKAPGPYGGILYFFLIIFLFTIAIGLLLTPVGPTFRNVPWLSIIAVALLITLLIAEMLPHHEKAIIIKREELAKKQDPEEDVAEEKIEKEFGIILVLILLILIGAIIYAFTANPEKFRMTF
ncbi:MAG: hypothetical protein U0X40_04455 [Ferruginibacter sp.]